MKLNKKINRTFMKYLFFASTLIITTLSLTAKDELKIPNFSISNNTGDNIRAYFYPHGMADTYIDHNSSRILEEEGTDLKKSFKVIIGCEDCITGDHYAINAPNKRKLLKWSTTKDPAKALSPLIQGGNNITQDDIKYLGKIHFPR